MSRLSRRQLVQGALGLGVVGAGGLLLHPHANATPASGTLGTYADFLARETRGVLLDVPKPPDRLVATGRAEYAPVAPNDSAEGRQKNRRIEITLIDKGLVQ